MLSEIPPYLLQLPCLSCLNLSFNKLKCLPFVPEWSEALECLDVSHNEMKSIEETTAAKGISTLNLAHNQFDAVPKCVTTFLSLQSLDLSFNSNLTCLPLEMGRLTQLHTLELTGLTKLNYPPPEHITSSAECVEYLYNKLHHSKPSYRMKIMVLGTKGSGKSTLIANLHGKYSDKMSTVGLSISEWKYRPNPFNKKFKFSIWEFGGQEEFYPFYRCFFTPASIYILLFNLKDSPADAVQEIDYWLDSISHRCKDSCVFLIGTRHSKAKMDDATQIENLILKVGEITKKYSTKLQIKQPDVLDLDDIKNFRKIIYETAEEYRFEGKHIMGQLVPDKSYSTLKTFLNWQKDPPDANHDPILHLSEYKALVKDMSCADSDDDIQKLSTFLVNSGAILHYNDPSHHLNELYFINPGWLCSIMINFFSAMDADPCIREGILLMKDKFIIIEDKFPKKYIDHFLTLLDRFEIALVLDRNSILIPSLLPENRPQSIDISVFTDQPVFTRCIVFGTKSTSTLQDVFSRFISQMIHALPKLQTFFKTISETNDDHESRQDTIILETQISYDNQQHNFMDVTQVRMDLWKTGIFYYDPQVTFLIESLAKSNMCEGQGIFMLASENTHGKSIFCEMVDICRSFFNEMCQRGFDEMIPCSMCLQEAKRQPQLINYKECFECVLHKMPNVQCGMKHILTIADVAPDMLLLDISPDFSIEYSEIKYDGTVLGKGAYGTVYKGQLKGKSIAVKKFQHFCNIDGFSELRREATLHQKLRHPCLLCLVGVSLHPELLLVLEYAPQGSLSSVLQKLPPVPLNRLVVYRIAAQVAAALRALHNKGVIYRDLKAANVLLWSTNPESLCHCKLCDFGTAAIQSAIGLESSVQGTKGFIAPEILHICKRGSRRAMYNHKADIFSFGMLLYEMIYLNHPFHDMEPVKIDSAVLKGKRPQLRDIPSASVFVHLTALMQECWHGNPQQRPATDDIIEKVSSCSFQLTMSVTELNTQSNSNPAFVLMHNQGYSQIWVFSTAVEEKTEIIPYSLIPLKQLNNLNTSKNSVKNVVSSGNFVWMCSSERPQPGIIELFSITKKESVHTISVGRHITCIACCNQWVYCATVDGHLHVFDSNSMTSNFKPIVSRKIASCAIDGLAVVSDCVWISFSNRMQLIYLGGFQNLQLITDLEADGSVIGQMKLSVDKRTIWSSNLCQSFCISLWSVLEKKKLDTINCNDYKDTENPETKMVITAMTPVLDTLWVCTREGYILILHERDLLMRFQVYEQSLYYMESIPYPGPCQTEKSMVISAGLHKHKVVPTHTLILFEAFPSKMCKQIKFVQDNSLTYLANHAEVTRMIKDGEFLDGTQIG